MVKAIVGLNWGDEGKGKMVDYFAAEADCVIRYQGGDNAGHTVHNQYGRFALHNIPSGISYPGVVNIVAPGSVVNLESFSQELYELNRMGINTSNVMLSERAVVIFPFHRLFDSLEETRLGEKKYDSTLSGIAPVYGDRYMKKCIQLGELLYPSELKEKVKELIEYKNAIITGLYHSEPLQFEAVWEWLRQYGEKIKPYIQNIGPVVGTMLAEGKEIIVEAQLGALRDINHGIYPYTTSSSTLAGYACASIPIPPSSLEKIIGITKAYSTCVGAGPFVTEIHDQLADEIRIKGREYGAKTGRPRRIGHFDAVATGYGCRLQGATEIGLTGLQVLSGQKEVKICTGYRLDGSVTTHFPINAALEKAVPVYESMEGWEEDISDIRRYEDLPVQVRNYVERIEALLGLQVKYLSMNMEREALIIR